MTAPLGALPLVRRITEHAYKAGAALVTTLFSDDEATLMRFRHAPDDSFDRATGWLFDGMAAAFRAGAARLAIVGDDPMLLSGQDPDKVARANRARSKAYLPALELIAGFDINWTIVSYATPAWAKAVFPADSEEVARGEALARHLRRLAHRHARPGRRTGRAHNRDLEKRSSYLNEKQYAALHFRGPGTDLRVGLADDHVWAGGATRAKNGIVCNPNIPTEEVFTTPHKDRVDGTVRSTKPLSYQGTLIEEIAVKLRGRPHRRGPAPRPARKCSGRCSTPTTAPAGSARWRWCPIPRRSRRAASSSSTRSSTRTPRATSRSARPMPNASATATS